MDFSVLTNPTGTLAPTPEPPQTFPDTAIVPEIVNGALTPNTNADPLEEARRLMTPWQGQMAQVKEQINLLQVTDEHTLAQATSVAGRAKKVAKAIDGARTSLVEPLNSTVKSINGLFTGPRDLFKWAAQACEAKINTYTRKIESARLAAEAAARKAAEELQQQVDAEAKEAGIAPVQVQAPVVEAAPKIVRTEQGTAGTVKKWKGEVVDLVALCKAIGEGKVSPDHVTVNMVTINAEIRAGVREIPGVRIFEDEKTVVRSH